MAWGALVRVVVSCASVDLRPLVSRVSWVGRLAKGSPRFGSIRRSLRVSVVTWWYEVT